MKTKIFEALKNKYANLGFSKEVLEGVATQLSAFVTKDEEVATAVVGAEQTLKAFQSFADSRVNAFKKESDQNKTEVEALKLKLAELEKGKGTPPPPAGDDVPDYVKTLQDTMQKMQETITEFQAQRVSQSLSENFIEKMKENEVPEHFYNNSLIGRTFENEQGVNDLAEAVAKNYDAFKQSSADLGFSFTKPPEKGGDPEEDSEILAKQIRARTKELVDKQN